MNKFSKVLISLAAAIGLAVGLTGCSSEPIVMSKVTSLIDVRTPAEYAAGHLQGAVNIDVENQSFTSEVQKLDLNGKYLVYCHSGRRAGIAVDTMKSLGFGDVTNIGGIDDAASATGLTVVQ